MTDYTLDVDQAIQAVASEVFQRYRGFVDREDLVQEAYLWVFEHPGRVRTLSENDEQKIAYLRLKSEVATSLVTYCRKQKSEALGYEPDDEVFYSNKQILAILPYVLADEYERQGEQQEVKAKTDPAHGGDFLASVLDVKNAWEKADLTPDEYDLVYRYVQDGLSMQQLADEIGVDVSTVSRRIGRACGKLVNHLGGREPKCSEGCAGCRFCSYGSRRPNVHSPDSGMNQLNQ